MTSSGTRGRRTLVPDDVIILKIFLKIKQIQKFKFVKQIQKFKFVKQIQKFKFKLN